jgi:chromatin remodeling complex protein RSC6
MAPKQTKTPKSTESASASVSAPVVEIVSAPLVVEVSPPVVDKAPKVKKAKAPKVEAAPVSEKASEPVLVVTEESITLVVADVETSVAEQSVEFLAKLQQLGVLISSLKAEYRTLEKKWTRELKTAQKQSSKRKRKAGNRAPSGFVKPTRISDELAKFLEKPSGSEMARTEVTRDINKYIRTHNLQDKENGRKINPDSKLATLLKLKKTDELTYFNLQRYMSPHFAKASKDLVTASAPVSVSA